MKIARGGYLAIFFAFTAAPAQAADPPAPSAVQSIAVYPTSVGLRGGDDSRQLIVTGKLPDGRLQDLTGDVHYTVADKATITITSAGRVMPQADGSTLPLLVLYNFSETFPVTLH